MRFLIVILVAAAATGTPAAVAGAQYDPVAFYHQRDSAVTALDAGDYEEAVRHFERLVADTPQNAELWAGLALAQFRLRRVAPAVEALERAQNLGHTFGAAGSYTAARIHAQLGNDSAAVYWSRRALDERYENRPRFRSDEAFARLREDSAFRRLAGIPPSRLSRDEGLRFDLAYLAAEARRLHADPARPTMTPAFAQAVARLDRDIPALSDEEVLIGFARILALLDDGHTLIYGPGEDSPLDLDAGALPLKFYLFPDGLRIVEADSAHQELVGARVERFGSVTPDSALAALRTLRGSDNVMTIRWLGPQFYLRSPMMLRAVGAASGDGAELHLRTDDGGPRRVRVLPSAWEARRKLRPLAAADTARWLRHVDTNYWLETLPGPVVYFQFNQVQDLEDGPDLATFARLLADTLRQSGATHLVVDLRHNNGGNNGLLRPLVRTLVAWEQAAPGNTIWVLTGRNTFSAAQNFLNRVERLTDAVVAGEPSSSSPNFVGEDTEIELPWSRIRGSISARYWQDSDPTDHRPWIYPDVPVALSWEDYRAGRDPVMRAVLAIIQGGGR